MNDINKDKENLNDLIQGLSVQIKDLKQKEDTKNKYDFAQETLSNLKDFKDMNKKNNASIATWISVSVAIIGLFITLAASYGTLRLTMQDYFNDVDSCKENIVVIDEEIKNLESYFLTQGIQEFKIEQLEKSLNEHKKDFRDFKNKIDK